MSWPKTGRTAYLSIRCKPESKDALHAVAAKAGITLGAALDEAVALLAAKYKVRVKK